MLAAAFAILWPLCVHVTDSVHICQDKYVLEWCLVLCVVLTNLSQLNMQILGCGAYTEKDFWAT